MKRNQINLRNYSAMLGLALLLSTSLWALQRVPMAHAASRVQQTDDGAELSAAQSLVAAEALIADGELDDALVILQTALALAIESDDQAAELNLLAKIGEIEQLNGDHENAIATLERLLSLQEELADYASIAGTLAQIGAIHALQGDLEEAYAVYAQAALSAAEIGNNAFAIAMWQTAGAQQREAGNQPSALSAYESAIAIARNTNDVTSELMLLEMVGNYLRAEGLFLESVEFLDAALTLRKDEEETQTAGLLALIGANYADFGDVDAALTYYAQAVAAARSEDDPQLAIAVLRAEGELRRSEADEEALAVFERALALVQEIEDGETERALHETIGNFLRADGDYEESNAAYEAALALRNSADLLALIGSNYATLGDVDKALEYYTIAISAALDEQNPALAIAVTRAEGDLRVEQGDLGALVAYNEALSLARESNDADNELALLETIGNYLRAQSEYADSNEAFEAALALREKSGASQSAELLALIGANYAAMGEADLALKYYEDAVAAAEQEENVNLAVATLRAEGDLRRAEGDQDALAAYTEALALAQATGEQDLELSLLELIGNLQRTEGAFADSNQSFLAALELRSEDDGTPLAELLALIGANYAELGEVDRALEYYRDAVSAAEQEENIKLVVAVRRAEGDLRRAQGDEGALAAYADALTRAQAIGDQELELSLLELIGNLLRAEGEYTDSNDALLAALELRKALDKRALADLLALIGANYAQLDEAELALQYYAEAIDEAQGEDNVQLAGAVLRAQGDLYQSLDDPEALTAYSAALTLAQESNNVELELSLRETIANYLRAQGDYAASIEAFQALLALLESDQAAPTAGLLALIGANYEALGQDTQALANYDAAVEAAEAEGDPDLVLNVMAAAGNLYAQKRQVSQAVGIYREILALAEDDTARTIDMLRRIGNLYRTQRSFASSTSAFQELLGLYIENDDVEGQAQTLALIGANFADAGTVDVALQYYDRAISAAVRDNDSAFAAAVQMAKANALQGNNDLVNATTAFNTAADMYRQAGDFQNEISALRAAARTLLVRKDNAGALVAYDAALAAAQRVGDGSEAAQIMLDKANLLWGIKRRDEASALYAQALDLARAANDGRTEATAHFYQALAHSSMRHYTEAQAALREVLAVAERRGYDDIELAARRQMWSAYMLTRQYDDALNVPNVAVGITSPVSGAVLRGEVSIEGLAQGPDFRKWQLDLLLNGEERDALFLGWSDNNPFWSGGRRWGELLVFDSANFPNGAHKLRLRIVRTDGNYDEYFVNIEIRN